MGEQRPEGPGVSCVGWPRRSLGGAAVGPFLFSTPARNLFSCPPHILPPLFLSDPKMTFLCVLYPYTLTPCIGVRKERVDVLCPNDLGQFSNFRQLCNWFFLKMLLSCFKYYSRDEKRIIHFPVEGFLFPDSCIRSVLSESRVVWFSGASAPLFRRGVPPSRIRQWWKTVPTTKKEGDLLYLQTSSRRTRAQISDSILIHFPIQSTGWL